MKVLGFWKGFRNENFPSIFDENLKKRTSRVDDKIMNYLKNGIWLTKLRTKFICPITEEIIDTTVYTCLLYTSPSPRDATLSRMPSSA